MIFSARNRKLTPAAFTAVWLASLVSTVLLPLGVVFFLDVLVEVRGFQPGLGPYVFAVGGALAIVSYVLAQRFRAEYREQRGLPALDDEPALRAYARKLFIGLGIAETPCYAAIFYYVLTRDVAWTLVLCAAAIVLVMLYKPAWPATRG
ncbi:MAG: hypothetical protein A2150_07600 [Candidatus Muproteobacteria bacterium RBG_16_64_11]|uniref:Uncharacterized protein n=1 Tax=Candidatus Muproteobacteria bacterium RBG_16_64_11 TaxID=1817758 RepID=A0A1F6TA63_9PROT|nr:MAG: hypothetical protein A2150_07600 [Candidatus Muproteobacteria bacterium RBG_16_64_11]